MGIIPCYEVDNIILDPLDLRSTATNLSPGPPTVVSIFHDYHVTGLGVIVISPVTDGLPLIGIEPKMDHLALVCSVPTQLRRFLTYVGWFQLPPECFHEVVIQFDSK